LVLPFHKDSDDAGAMPAVPILLPPLSLPMETGTSIVPKGDVPNKTPTSPIFAAPDAGFKPRDSGLFSGRLGIVDTGLPRPLFANLGDFLEAARHRDYTRKGALLVLVRHGTSVFNRLHDVFYDSLDSPLTEEGRDSARNLGAILKRFPVRAIYTSPVERAFESAVLMDAEIASERGITVVDDLAEISLGLLDAYPCRMNAAAYDVFLKRMLDSKERAAFAKAHGLTPSEADVVFRRAFLRRHLVRNHCATMGTSEDAAVKTAREGLPALDYRGPLGGSSFEDIREQAVRVREFLARSESAPGSIVLCSHGMMNRVLLLELSGAELTSREQLSRIRQDTGCANVLWRKNDSGTWRLFVLNGS
jgi:broad specificity phosphatase PhoE